MVEEKEKRTAAERAVTRAAGRVADLRAALASSSNGADAVQQLRAEAARLREVANTELPKCDASSPPSQHLMFSCSSLCMEHMYAAPEAFWRG